MAYIMSIGAYIYVCDVPIVCSFLANMEIRHSKIHLYPEQLMQKNFLSELRYEDGCRSCHGFLFLGLVPSSGWERHQTGSTVLNLVISRK